MIDDNSKKPYFYGSRDIEIQHAFLCIYLLLFYSGALKKALQLNFKFFYQHT